MPADGRPLRVAALGYYGFGNLGDEAVLAGIRCALEERAGATEILVLTHSAEATGALHPGVRAVNRWRWREVASALRGTDVFILGGGSLLQDATSARSVLWYSLMALLARRRARRVIWWGQGIGPLHSASSRRWVRWIAREADAITVRDAGSARLLREIGVRRAAEEVGDPAFALTPAAAAGDDPVTILALRAWQNSAALASTFADEGIWQRLSSAAGGKLMSLPFHLPEDAEFQRSLPAAAEMSSIDWQRNGMTPQQVLGCFANAGMTVAMRLHALIFSARCGTPFVALSYDPKVDALAAAAGQADALIPLKDLTADRLIETTETVYRTRQERRKHLEAFALEQSRRARRPVEIIAGWFG